MFSFSHVCRILRRRDLLSLKHISSDPNVILIPHLDDTVKENVDKGLMTPKKHPGKLSRTLTVLNDEIIRTIEVIIKDSQYKNLLRDAQTYCKYVKSRQPPATKSDVRDKSTECYWKAYGKMDVDLSVMEENEREIIEQQIKRKAYSLLKSCTYSWKPIEYTTYVGKQYLVNRMAAEYSVLNRIFQEIATRCPDFEPDTLFDFGSGVGTVTWVARKYWEKSLCEYYNVDISSEMNEIARQMLTGGDDRQDAELPIKNVFYRQFLPSRSDRKYKLVVSSYTLLELPSAENRLQTIMKLWNKTEDFLILVEHGNKAGFRLVAEARDFILDTEAESSDSVGAHVFAPCPHDFPCPMMAFTEKPCCSKSAYEKSPIGRKREIFSEFFAYVVLRKGKRPADDPQWPRLVFPVVKKSSRASCLLCSKNGKFQRYEFTKSKHGTTYYHFGRSLKSGDRLPMSFSQCDLNDLDEDGVEVKEIQNEDEIPDIDDDEGAVE